MELLLNVIFQIFYDVDGGTIPLLIVYIPP